MVDYDWPGFEKALVDGVVDAVRSVVAAHPHERFYAAALDRIYRETDGAIGLPSLAIDTVEALGERGDVDHDRWNAGDWEHDHDDWLPHDLALVWDRGLNAYARRGSRDEWQETFDKYISTLVRVCQHASRGSGATGFPSARRTGCVLPIQARQV